MPLSLNNTRVCLKVKNTLFAIVLLVLLAGCQTRPDTLIPSPGQNHQARQYTIEQFLDITHYRGNSFSTDGSKILLSSDQTGVDNAFAIQVNGGGAAQLEVLDGRRVVGGAIVRGTALPVVVPLPNPNFDPLTSLTVNAAGAITQSGEFAARMPTRSPRPMP